MTIIFPYTFLYLPHYQNHTTMYLSQTISCKLTFLGLTIFSRKKFSFWSLNNYTLKNVNMFVSWTISMPKLHWLVVVKVQLFNISLRMWVNSKSCQNANCDWVDIKNIKVIGPNNSQVKSGKKPINKSTSLFYYGTCARKYLKIDKYFLFPSALVLQCKIKWLSISIIISIIVIHEHDQLMESIYMCCAFQ